MCHSLPDHEVGDFESVTWLETIGGEEYIITKLSDGTVINHGTVKEVHSGQLQERRGLSEVRSLLDDESILPVNP